jgi:cell wall-associated NlpC family hydrolase
LSLDKAQFHAGDMIFFGQEDTHGGEVRNRHVGIACGDGRFIHASGRELNFGVYIDSCSEPFYVERYMKALRLSPSVNLAIDNA